MAIDLEVPAVVVEPAAIRTWITTPDAGARASAAAGNDEGDGSGWWGHTHVGDHHPGAHFNQDSDWIEDLLLYVAHSHGLFGQARLRGWLVKNEYLGVKDWSLVVGLEVASGSGSGEAVNLVKEIDLRTLIFPTPEGTATDVTVEVLTRLGNIVLSLTDDLR